MRTVSKGDKWCCATYLSMSYKHIYRLNRNILPFFSTLYWPFPLFFVHVRDLLKILIASFVLIPDQTCLVPSLIHTFLPLYFTVSLFLSLGFNATCILSSKEKTNIWNQRLSESGRVKAALWRFVHGRLNPNLRGLCVKTLALTRCKLPSSEVTWDDPASASCYIRLE